MLSAWDACEECDEVLQKVARGDWPHSHDGLQFAGAIVAYVGFLTLVHPLFGALTGAVGALAIVTGLTTVGVQWLRSRRYRKSILAGALPLPPG